jgi:hypothetical protein
MEGNIETKTITLFNSSDKNVAPYPIEEASIDPATGDVTIDPKTQTYRKTGRTLLWEIKAGETMTFPLYVGKYLQSIYGFLKVAKTKAIAATGVSDEQNNS